MGNVTSRPEDGGVLVLRDQSRLSIASLTITNTKAVVLLNVVPNIHPATRVIARKDYGDETLVEFVQDPESTPTSLLPPFLIRLKNDDDLLFNFTFTIRQNTSTSATNPVDTQVTGLTFALASTARELDNLVTTEFHADPNLHKNPNVELLGDFSTDGNLSTKFDWSWKWHPPRGWEDKGGGWRNTCCFAEYDQRAHKLQTLASFSFWVQNTRRSARSATLSPVPAPSSELMVPLRARVPSSHSVRSAPSESDHTEFGPPSPNPEQADSNVSSLTVKEPLVFGVNCPRPGDDMTAVDDGPLFRATVKALEQKTGSMRTRMKKVLRKAEAAQAAQVECNAAVTAFMEALREASISNANAVQPALEHYFEKIAKQILQYEKQNTVHLQKLIIDPLAKIYNVDIKQAESKKKDFEEESKEYYAYVSRYLGQRQDSLKEKKRIESDTKYQDKRRRFELKRFDYSSFMQDLHGGRKEQEVLSQLTKYAETQSSSFLNTAKKVGEMNPQLLALIHEVQQADKDFKLKRTEREEKRRTIEKSTKPYVEPDAPPIAGNSTATQSTETEITRADSTGGSGLHYSSSTASQHGSTLSSTTNGASSTPNSRPTSGVPIASPDRFKGIRDLEERDHSINLSQDTSQHRREGLLWALSRPDSHVDMKGLNKQAWHKFWIVLDQGRLSEYSNWKQRLDLHMEPIDLRMASVREARNAERRFCFEVITPHFKRVYQAPSEEEMHSWINALNNALQSAVEGRAPPKTFPKTGERPGPRDIGSVLTGKSSSYSGHHNHGITNASPPTGVYRHRTVGARPQYLRADSNSLDESPSKLLQVIRDNDQGNRWCADCNSEVKVEWVSINLGIVVCIECSGIHRSLGTHISKIRSLTLDTASFTTDIVELLLQIGNRISNMVWEAKLEPSEKLASHASREQRLRFITNKYVDRLFVETIGSSTHSHYPTADESLLASIKKNDIQGVMYALALRANPNAADRSRNTHCIFLALAAADPARPGGSAAPSPSPSPSAKTIGSKQVHVFPVAEMLVQNGAIIPSTLPGFPLSTNAQLYVDQRSGRGADTLGDLPKISQMSASGYASREQGKEGSTKLQKKGSIGGKLTGKPG